MQSVLVIAMVSIAGLVAASGAVAAPADPAASHATQLAQNTGAADRTLGNGSMGVGEGIGQLPEREDEIYRDRDQRTSKAYDESGHGDNDTDMEHRPRRTLGDSDDD